MNIFVRCYLQFTWNDAELVMIGYAAINKNETAG